MLIPFDPSLLLSLLGIVLAILVPLLAFGENPLLLKLIRGIDKDLSKSNKDLLSKARKYTHEKNLSGKKLRIHRLLGNFPEERETPRCITAVAGMAILGLVFCLFFALITYVYSGVNKDSFINWLLIAGQISLFVEFVIFWFGKTFDVKGSTLYLVYAVFLLLVGFAVGAALSFTDCFFHVFPTEQVKWFYLGTLLVPFMPIITAAIELLSYWAKERRKYKQLNRAVKDFETFKNTSRKKTNKS